ncbi:hypothetical protein GSH19_05010 [Lactobacillus sp. S2-2]|uniref:hypothetical protein n=1 Tax=Lactobacillus sp. S2-2 TaxID=2692917 RepID=UPI001F33E745|nr:hypothetical protein [Lactobacillus sp. S2-2]MCF6515511.1 hypothetical protein [Lactobacillus sp. S2-2]
MINIATKEYYRGLELIHKKQRKYNVPTINLLPDHELKEIRELMNYETKAELYTKSAYRLVDFEGNTILKASSYRDLSLKMRVHFEDYKSAALNYYKLQYAVNHFDGLTLYGRILKY